MKENIIKEYLEFYPNEKIRQSKLLTYIKKSTKEEIIDWNNFKGHIVASGFIYAEKENKVLLLFHKDLEKYLYPGGHIDKNDQNPLDAAIREIKEETGLSVLNQIRINNNRLIPIDIDTHKIKKNKRLLLPKHYHYDFRYLFTIEEITDIKIDSQEINNYIWLDFNKFEKLYEYKKVAKKIRKLIMKGK